MARKNKIILITGINGGIGSAIAKHFKKNGFCIIGSDLQRKSKYSDIYIPCDLNLLATDAYLQKSFQKTLFPYLKGGLDCLINNAALQIVKPALELSMDDWKNTINVNLLAPFFLTKTLAPFLKKKKGHVINISSIHDKLSKPNFVAYATSKAALSALTRYMAIECSKDFSINAICPAAVSTPMLKAGFEKIGMNLKQLEKCHPANYLAQPKEIAELAYLITQLNTSFLTGTNFYVDGGIGNCLLDPVMI